MDSLPVEVRVNMDLSNIHKSIMSFLTKKVTYEDLHHDEIMKELEKPAEYTIKDRNLKITDDDIQEARRVLFSEISNRSPDKQTMETEIVLNTALNRMVQYAEKGLKKTLKDVLQMPNQYQGYNPDDPKSQYSVAATEAFDELSKPKMQLIDSVLERVKKEGIEDNTQNSVFYVHDKDGRIWLKDGKLFK